MAHAVDHPARLRVVLDLDRVADTAQAQRAQRVDLALVGAVLALDLRDLHDCSPSSAAGASASGSAAAGSSASAAGSSAGAEPSIVSTAPFSWVIPRTWLIDRPRSSATSSGRRRPWRPATVALTRLIGFWEPSDLESTSWIPASSSTARTPPPAMTPVPGEAGRSSTRPEPNTPSVWWVIVWPCLGTRNRFFFARSTAFWIASGTS